MTDTTITASVCHAMNGHGEAREAPKSQHNLKMDGMNEGMRVLSYLISGVLLYGFLGWVGDHFLGTSFLLPIGIVAGAALGCYVIIQRFGRVEDSAPSAGDQPVSAESTANAKEGPR